MIGRHKILVTGSTSLCRRLDVHTLVKNHNVFGVTGARNQRVMLRAHEDNRFSSSVAVIENTRRITPTLSIDKCIHDVEFSLSDANTFSFTFQRPYLRDVVSRCRRAGIR